MNLLLRCSLPELSPLVVVCFVTAGVSAAHVVVLAVLVTGAPGEDGGTEAGEVVIHGADPVTSVMRGTLGAGLVTPGLLHPVDAFVEVAEVLVAQQRAVAVINAGLALRAMGKVLTGEL